MIARSSKVLEVRSTTKCAGKTNAPRHAIKNPAILPFQPKYSLETIAQDDINTSHIISTYAKTKRVSGKPGLLKTNPKVPFNLDTNDVAFFFFLLSLLPLIRNGSLNRKMTASNLKVSPCIFVENGCQQRSDTHAQCARNNKSHTCFRHVVQVNTG